MRWVAGLLLVSAALLKAADLMSDPAAAVLNPYSKYILPAQIDFELGIGLLLLSGLYWRSVRWLVLALFTGFAAYSLYLALNGATSCGCFGPVEVSPWWTFGLDSAVVLGLLISVLADGRVHGIKAGSSERPFANKVPRHRHPQVIAFAISVAVISTAVLFRHVGQRTAMADGLLTSVGELVILEPERWIGQKLPIADAVDVDLSQGEWIVLMYRHDCPVCQEEVPRYEQRGADGERIALVEVPPYGDLERRRNTCLHGRLKDNQDWFVQTPVEIRLHDGDVIAVNMHEH